MSTFKVPLTTVREIKVHPNAHSLEIVKIYDFDVIVRKDTYIVGQRVVYIPVDSILPQSLENVIFGADSKIKLNKHRVRQIKIRSVPSQGMIIHPEEILSSNWKGNLEDDLAPILGITKYEPPVDSVPCQLQLRTAKRHVNPNFAPYTDIENFKYYDRVLQDNEPIYISTKLHGTSFRCGWVTNEANTFWKKVLKFFKVLPEHEFCWGSRRVQIQANKNYQGFYEEDIYSKVVHEHSLITRIPKGYSIYGEIVGDGIQKGYLYGCEPGQHRLFVYDVKFNGEYVDYYTFNKFCIEHGLDVVPLRYIGPYKREILDSHLTINPLSNEPNEGVVVRTLVERKSSSLNRVILKYINPAYYEHQDKQDGTEFH
jgi:RNA ligase (TIGR02306 family)